MEKHKTSVYVGGKEYVLVSAEPPAYMQRVAEYADRVMREPAAATHLPALQANALAAVNLADELMKAQDENTRLRRQLREAMEELQALREAAK